MRLLKAVAASTFVGAMLCTEFSSLAIADTTLPAAAPKPATLIFISPDTLSPGLFLPVPPSPGSDEGQAQLAEVRATVKAATPEQIKQAAEDDADEAVTLFQNVLPGFDLSKLPATAKLFADVENDEEIVVKKAKTFFARKRPFELDQSITTCVPSKLGKAPTSYPSGHSTLGYTDGIVLAHLIPAKADVILARAKAYAANRVVCGVHFASDGNASQALATGLVVEMMHSAQFQAEFDAAKTELIAAGLTN